MLACALADGSMCIDRRGKIFLLSAPLLSKQAGEAWIVLELEMRVERGLNDLNKIPLLELFSSLHWYHKRP
jgi:hypothetical protein